MWDQQRERVVIGTPQLSLMPSDDPYMMWHRAIMRRGLGSPLFLVHPRPQCIKWLVVLSTRKREHRDFSTLGSG